MDFYSLSIMITNVVRQIVGQTVPVTCSALSPTYTRQLYGWERFQQQLLHSGQWTIIFYSKFAIYVEILLQSFTFHTYVMSDGASVIFAVIMMDL
jgi:hypothetical protein